METVANIFLKSDKSFEINEVSQIPILMNNNLYDYYLSLLSFSYLNCSPNIAEIQTFKFKYLQTPFGETDPVEYTEIKDIQPGLYDSQDLLNLINSFFHLSITDEGTHTTYEGDVLKFSINPFNEYIDINFNTTEASKVRVSSVTIEVTAGSLLNNDLFRIPVQNITFIQGNPNWSSNKAFRISTYNNVMLTSTSLGITSLIGVEQNDYEQTDSHVKGITTSSALYVVSSVASPFSTVTYTAIQPIDFSLGNRQNITNFQFKLVDENNNDLKLLPNGTPDFSVKLAIKRRLKVIR